MNIKSLLLGSAAALLVVSGSRAADAAVVAEPEPIEYVRICDVYGAGFYYIPGTETCLKIGSLVRYQINLIMAKNCNLTSKVVMNEGGSKVTATYPKLDAYP